MAIHFSFIDDEGFIWEYMGNNVYSSQDLITVGNSTANVVITQTTLTVNNSITANSAALIVLTSNTANINVITANSANVINLTCNTFTLNVSSIATSGYTSLPNGLLMQWGQVTITNSAAVSLNVSWPKAFTTNAYSVTATPNIVSNVAILSINSTVFQLYSSANGTIFYHAIGV